MNIYRQTPFKNSLCESVCDCLCVVCVFVWCVCSSAATEHVWSSQNKFRCWPLLPSLLEAGSSVVHCSVLQTCWPESTQEFSVKECCNTDTCNCHQLSVCSADSYSGSHIYVASTWFTEPFPHFPLCVSSHVLFGFSTHFYNYQAGWFLNQLAMVSLFCKKGPHSLPKWLYHSAFTWAMK